MNSAKFAMADMPNRALPREEESKLLKRHAHKPKKPYLIESRMPNSTIPAFTKWRFSGRYETKARRDQALHVLQKRLYFWDILLTEYRASEE